MSRGYSIKEISKLTGLSEDTIRYYEKIGVLPQAKRAERGRRYYDQTDLEVMQTLLLLKRAGMSLDELKAYTDIAFKKEVPASREEQLKLIHEHRMKVRRETEFIQEILQSLEMKLIAGTEHPEEERLG